MDNLGTLCLVGVILIVALFILPRLMRGFGAPDYSQRGPEQPGYDDPNIRSRGGFGGWGGGRRRREYDDPDIDSRGSFGSGGNSGRSSWGGGLLGGRRGSSGTSGRADSPNIRSRGSFGGRK